MKRERDTPGPIVHDKTSKVTPPPADGPDAWDRCAAWLAAHGALPALGVLTIVVGVVYAGVFRGEPVGDDLTFHFAESARLADCIRHGDFDFWNPSANGGFASAYYYQVIPQLASALPTAVFGHHLFWFQLSVFLPLVLAPAAAYRGMRFMGAVPWQALSAAIAIAFTIGTSRWGFSADGTFSVGLYTQTWALAAFPLALGHSVRWLTDGKSLPAAIGWGAFVGLCHPFGGVSLGLALACGVIGGVLFRRSTWHSPIVSGIVLLALGALVAPIYYVLTRHAGAGGLVPTGLILAGIGWLGFGIIRKDPTWRAQLRIVFREPVRLIILGVALAIAAMPGYITLVIDSAGFGGFPHRVNDEVGPGFKQLGKWLYNGMLFDHGRTAVLTFLLPLTILLGRGSMLRWLWAPALVFALLLGLGPHMPKTADDLIPAVRFLGAMQIVVALAIGAGAYATLRAAWTAPIGSPTWNLTRYALAGAVVIGAPLLAAYLVLYAPDTSGVINVVHVLTGRLIDDLQLLRVVGAVAITIGLLAGVVPMWRALGTEFGIRTGLSAIVAALLVLIVLPGAQVQHKRVRVLADFPGSHRAEMMTIIDKLKTEPHGRKQVGPGCENHWWNLLSYVYARVPALLQMGGGGLQASPNYDYLWTIRDWAKNAWLFDAPYLVFAKSKATGLPVGELVLETETYIVRRLPTPGLVSPVQITGVLPAGPTGAKSEARKSVLAWGKTNMPLEDRVLAYNGFGTKTTEPKGKTLRSWRQHSPGDEADLVAEVEATEPTTFMFRESWHPRWKGFVDGVEVTLKRVSPDFPAIEVGPGKHVIQLRFERPWWAQVAWLAWPSVVLAAWFVLRRRERGRIPRARVVG